MRRLVIAAVAAASCIASSVVVARHPANRPSLEPQVQNEQLANAIAAARARNAGLLAQYNWNSRTEILDNGKLVDLRIDLVNLLPSGQLSRQLLNDEPGRLPRGFLRHAIAQSQQQQAEEAAQALGRLVDQYTLPAADKIVAFIIQAQVQPITGPAGQSLLQVSGTNVVVPGDSLTMTFDGTTLLPTGAEISTTLNSQAATISASFDRMRSGLNRLQFATGSIPGKQLTVNIHNYDFVQSQ